jgi:hypothetical protein
MQQTGFMAVGGLQQGFQLLLRPPLLPLPLKVPVTSREPLFASTQAADWVEPLVGP